MVIPAAGRTYKIPFGRDPKHWNLSILLREPSKGPNLVMHTSFLPEIWIFRFCEEYP